MQKYRLFFNYANFYLLLYRKIVNKVRVPTIPIRNAGFSSKIKNMNIK